MRRFMRAVVEFEIEVTDVTQAAAYTFDFSVDEEGGLGMAPYPSDEEQMRAAVERVVFDALSRAQDEAGFRPLGGSAILRPVEGDEHPAYTVGRAPARRDDGSFHFESAAE